MTSFLKYIPNSLSLVRILLVFPMIYFLYHDNFIGILLLCLAIVLSDYFDGFLARKWKATSTTGKVLDPIADKICVVVIGIALVVIRKYPVPLVMVLIARDILILGASLYTIRKLNEIPVSNTIGRTTVGFISASMLVYLFDLKPLMMPSVIAVLIMIPISLFSYSRRLIRLIKSRRGEIPR